VLKLSFIVTDVIASCGGGYQKIVELSLTDNRHEIISELTSEVVTQSIFPNTVEEVMDLDEHIRVTDRVLNSLESFSHCIVYITGLTILVQALYISWSKHVKANGKHRHGQLILAHRDRTLDAYKLFDSLTGESINPRPLSKVIKFNNSLES
jgi:hypothetical protein